MDQSAWTMLLAGIDVSCGLFALGVALYPKVKTQQQGYPFEAEIEATLLPIIFQWICSAYRLSEQSVDSIHERIRGADKKRIADSIYAMLPDKISTFEIVVVKRVVSQERFQQLVQNIFDSSDRFFVEHQAHFDKLFEKWKAANANIEQAQVTREKVI
jgi:hypothetical protein